MCGCPSAKAWAPRVATLQTSKRMRYIFFFIFLFNAPQVIRGYMCWCVFSWHAMLPLVECASYVLPLQELLEEEEYQLMDGTKKTSSQSTHHVFSGPITNQKIGIANYMLIDYNARVKKQTRNALCPWLEPVTQNFRNRIILAELRETYNWQLSLENFKGKEMLLSYLESL